MPLASHLHHTAPPTRPFQPAPLRPLRWLPLTWAQPQKQHEGAHRDTRIVGELREAALWIVNQPGDPFSPKKGDAHPHPEEQRGQQGWLAGGASLHPENPEGTGGHSRGAQRDPAAQGPREKDC